MSSSAIALTVATTRSSSGGRKRTQRDEQARGVERRRCRSAGRRRRARRCRARRCRRGSRRPRLPALAALVVLAQARQARAAVAGDPAHDLRRGEVLGSPRTSQIPRSGSRQAAIACSTCLHEDLHTSTRPARRATWCAGRSSPAARPRRRAASGRRRRCRRAPAGRARSRRGAVEHLLGQRLLAADAVHDLQLARRPRGDVADEVEEVVGLLVEAERVEAPEHEGRVADPRVAVVPVALAAGRLGQRRGRRRDHRAGRRVGQPLERQRAALQVGAPRVVGELAVARATRARSRR